MKNYFIIFLLLFVYSCVSQQYTCNSTCKTQYPILLVHGIAWRDDVALKKYWGTIPQQLEKHGATVFLANQNAYNSFEDNAIQIKTRIEEILKQTNAEKINIIAHSKGGLDARYMISCLGMENKVASLTTISTPHHGSSLATEIFVLTDKLQLQNQIVAIAKTYAKIIGDKKPDVWKAWLMLTPQYMEVFNNEVLNSNMVYYQSYGSVLTDNYPMKVMVWKKNILEKNEGRNDGDVSETSCQWGEYKGLVWDKDSLGISHFDIIGFTNKVNFDVNLFYINIVKELAEKGF